MRILIVVAIILFSISQAYSQETSVQEETKELSIDKINDVQAKSSNYDEPAMAKKCRKKREPKKCTSAFVQQYVFKRLRIPNDLSPGMKEIVVHFTINEEGQVTNIIAEGNSESLKQAGIDLARDLPDFIPAKLDGNPVSVQFTLPLKFMKP